MSDDDDMVKHVFTKDEAIAFLRRLRGKHLFVHAEVSLQRTDGRMFETQTYVKVTRSEAIAYVSDLMTNTFMDLSDVRIRVHQLERCVFFGCRS